MENHNVYDFHKKYLVPTDYNPPTSYDDQAFSTQYPNINTSQYRQKPQVHETKFWPFIECLTRNSEGTIILGSNNYIGRILNGSFFAFENVDEDEPQFDTKEIAFKVGLETPITTLKYVSDTFFLISESNGRVTYFNTKSVIRSSENPNKYCLFNVGNKTEHQSLVNSMDIFREKGLKAVTGDIDGCLVTWDLTGVDLTLINVYRYAHLDAINGISTALDNNDCFVTASDDKTLLHWDMRDPRPAFALLESHPVQLKAVEYLNDHQVLVGDRAGCACVIDTKMPKNMVFEQEIHNRPIHQFIVKGNNVVCLSDSNRLQVKQFNGNNMTSILDVTEAPNFLRGALWINETEFYVAGWSSFVKKYRI